VLPTQRGKDGYHRVLDPKGRAGDEYLFRKEGMEPFPDPAACSITKLGGRSIVVDHGTFHWRDDGWERPSFRDLVIYEIHVGTFTPEGTFRAVIDKLSYLRELGVNAIELMPIADFPGDRNWGYDGVLLYAPAKNYGPPDDLRALEDEAHLAGIAVILDVVYNHLGPDGNYLPACSRQFFSKSHESPWGQGFNFDGVGSRPVRDFFLQNLSYWMEEFHMDGFRLDATHAIKDSSTPHILTEIADMVHQRGGYILAEDERNDDEMLDINDSGGNDFDAAWADDFHHCVRVAMTGDRSAYFKDFTGTAKELADILNNGWLYRGQTSAFNGKNRGTECAYLPPSKFVYCISNHDQVGNRAFGERLSRHATAQQYRAVSALLCLAPYTPMLFMGQEWSASTPFQFFTNHNDELGPLVTEGRRKEFASFPEFADPQALDSIPDPQDPATFERSKLDWSETSKDEHRKVLALYKACLALRATRPAFRPATRGNWSVSTEGEMVVLRFKTDGSSYHVLANLWGPCSGGMAELSSNLLSEHQAWKVIFSSNEYRFGGVGASYDQESEVFTFEGPETVILQSSTPAG